MIRHIVLFRFIEGTNRETRQMIIDALRALDDQIPEIAAYAVEQDLGLGTRSFDLAIIGDFRTVEEFRAYQSHPKHLDVAKAMSQYRADSAVIQIGAPKTVHGAGEE